jgi:TRAP transporter TAXI family solute receptor
MLPALSRIGRNRTLQGCAAALVVLGLLLWWLLPLGGSSPGGSIVLSTGAKDGVYHTYGTLLKGYLADDLPDVSIRLQDSEGSLQNLQRVADGEANFAIATADAVAAYVSGRPPGASSLRGCARLYDDYVQLVVPKGSSIRSVADLRGRRVGTGQKRSGVRLIADRILQAAGLDPRRDVQPEPVGISDMPRLLETGRIDAFFWSGGLPTAAVQTLAERFPVRLVPLSPGLIAQLHTLDGSMSRYYRSAEIPADAYQNARGGKVPAVLTVAVANLLVTTERTDRALTEAVTRTVIRSRDSIGERVHPAQLVDLRTAIYTAPLPLDEGARRYYRSVKP